MNLEAQIKEAVLEERYYNGTFLYDIHDKILAKPISDIDGAQNEFEIGKFLYQNKIQVPQFHDLIYLSDFDDEEGKRPHYIVIEKIIGKKGLYLNGDIKELAVKQLLVEVDKIIDLPIEPGDCTNPGNAIFNFEENKMYLVDFGMYEFIKGPKNLQELREQFKCNIINRYQLK